MTQTLKIQHLPPEAIHSLMTHFRDYVKIAMMEKATQLECSLETAIEMAIASFLDSEAFSFEDCLLSQRLNPLLSVSAENNLGWLYHKTFTKNLDFSHSVRK